MNPKFKKWTKWIDNVYFEVANLVYIRQCFNKLQNMIQQNKKIQMPCSFWDFCEDTYVAYSVMACRRQIKPQSGGSLKGLLKEIIETPDVLSRKEFVNLYPDNMQRHAMHTFDDFCADGCKNHIDPTIVWRDLCELESHGGTSGKLVKFADKVIAHRDKRPPKIPTFNELDDCIDTLEKLTIKYRLLIKANDEGESLSIPLIEDCWEEIFSQPWILSE